MQRVQVSSQQIAVHKLGNCETTLSSKFRLVATQYDYDQEFHQPCICMEPLIPGLPDDIALSCLVLVSVNNHHSCKAVCKRWYSLFGSKEQFFTLRKKLGFHEPWLVVFAYHKCTGKMEWKVLNLIQFSWYTIPSMPYDDKVCLQGFQCVSMQHEGILIVCGGVASDKKYPLNSVMKYEMRKNQWSPLKKMITARSSFASGVIDRKIYVAGGNISNYFELNSAEVLDPKNETWNHIANMGKSMASYDAAVLNGKLLVTEGWFWPFCVAPRGQVYDPITDKWEDMDSGLREGWTGSSVVLYGHLFVVTEHERTKLKVYYMETDSWDVVDGPPLPDQICKPFCVNCWECNIYVVGRNLNVAVGRIKRIYGSNHERNYRFSVDWKMIDGPATHFDLTPSSAQVLFA